MMRRWRHFPTAIQLSGKNPDARDLEFIFPRFALSLRPHPITPGIARSELFWQFKVPISR